jgi:hypothetical protein
MLQVGTDDVRDYLRGNIRAGAPPPHRVPLRAGAHSGRYVRDPDGMDILPSGWEEPPH